MTARPILLASHLAPTLGLETCVLRLAEALGNDLDLVATVEAATAAGTPPPTLPGAPADPEPFRTAYGGDPLTDDQLAFVVDPTRCVPDTVHHYFQPVRWSEAGDVPVTYVHTTRDRPVRPEAQQEMLARLLRAEVVAMDVGHLPMVTDPEALAAVIMRARPSSER